MGNWGSDLFGKKDAAPTNLQETIDKFPPSLKQAMFAAASRTTIRRQTWNGCAMNAAGIEVGKNNQVQSLETAAAAFGISSDLVDSFIKRWDILDGSDEECTQLLRNMIEKAGLFRKPGSFNIRVFEQKKRDEFEHLFTTHQVPDEDIALDILDGSLAGV